jgi:hypothetical protein
MFRGSSRSVIVIFNRSSRLCTFVWGWLGKMIRRGGSSDSFRRRRLILGRCGIAVRVKLSIDRVCLGELAALFRRRVNMALGVKINIVDN